MNMICIHTGNTSKHLYNRHTSRLYCNIKNIAKMTTLLDKKTEQINTRLLRTEK